MEKTFTNEEVLKDGTTKISTYNASSHTLLGYYHLNSEGKKDGIEVEYSKSRGKEFETTTLWKDGEIVGKPKIFNITHTGEKLRIVQHISDLENNQTHKVNLSYKLDEIKGSPLEKILSHIDIEKEEWSFSNMKDATFLAGKCVSLINPIEITIKDNQIQHLKIVAPLYHSGSLTHVPNAIYDMEFKDGKEYNGRYYTCDEKGKEFTLYECTEGKYQTSQRTFPFVTPVLSEELMKEPQHITAKMSDEARTSVLVYQQLNKEVNYITGKNFIVTPDNVEKLPAVIYTPRNGTLSLGSNIVCNFEMKDGKLNGELSLYNNYHNPKTTLRRKAHYKDNKLDGPYQEFFKNSSQVRISGSYKDDKKHGIWKYYDENGNVLTTEFWRDGKNETEKFKAIKKIVTQHSDEPEPKTKIGKVISKGVKTLEIAKELAKSRKYRSN
ncbi:MAG: hypothetical protein IJ019_01545 [Alphaproteobacteria bacterium]|nr:hypothetical protein [Alphaproteobacteria bacterium]